eukprot:TRINITY_DN1569_c0_g1_i3.p1 TRINITY_DN1569_c0_g1~~TRINITY_DN1569_c0_g1_i3.p1  ORF type:complete len:333 (-),score=56.72 TRINITY_DN1569_c0_g1_i3:458-1456(-)
MNSRKERGSRARSISASGGAQQDQFIRIDELGGKRLLRTESLTSSCLLIVAACAMGFMLYFLRTILVPFFIAIFFMHLLQPVVNLLSRPPRRWCNKCTKRNGELCCEGMNTLTRSRRYSDISDGGTAHVTPAPAVLSGGATGFRHRPHQLSVDLDDEALAPPPALTCMDYPIIPRWLAVIMALVLAVSLVIVLGVIVYTSVMNLETQFYRYEEGASNLAKLLKKYMALVDYSLDEDVVPWLFKTMRDLTPRVLAMVLSSVAYMIYVVIFLTFLLISPTRPIPSRYRCLCCLVPVAAKAARGELSTCTSGDTLGLRLRYASLLGYPRGRYCGR